MTTYTIILGTGPYTSERPYTALRFAYTALLDDIKVNMFLFEDSIFTVKKAQQPANVYNLEEWVKKCMEEEGFQIAACGVCMKTRGMQENELIEGVKLGTMELCLNMVKESDKELFF
jgi:uncharacterized protein involved in oxidation of intracellular sulfur